MVIFYTYPETTPLSEVVIDDEHHHKEVLNTVRIVTGKQVCAKRGLLLLTRNVVEVESM
jgi:hypothetical protein